MRAVSWLLWLSARSKRLKPEMFHHSCLLCSEATPHYCHRRLVCEYRNNKWDGALKVHDL